MSTVQIAYNPNDFYYVSSSIFTDLGTNQNDILNNCNNFLTTGNNSDYDNKCGDIDFFENNSNNCFKYELCKNKQNSDTIMQLQNKTTGESERNIDYQNKYNNELLKTVNISASIIFITYLSIYFFK